MSTAAAATRKSQSLAKKDTSQTQALANLIESRKHAFSLVAGEHFKPERLVKLAQGALARTPKLAQCTPGSVLVALMRCAELDLEPDSALPQRRMWLVPRWNSDLRGQECTYIMDYRAQIQKARETGLVKSIIATDVRKADRFALKYDADGVSITKFEFEPNVFGDRGEVVGYFAAARLEGGEVQIAFLSKSEADAFRDRRAPKSKDGRIVGPWSSDFDAMAIKTCLRKLWNLLPAGKSEAARLLQARLQEEADIEHGKAVQSTAPVELSLGTGSDTATEVETALTSGEEAPPALPPDDTLAPGNGPASMREPGEEG